MARTGLLCIGNAIVDVFAQADSAFMERWGITEAAQHVERSRLDLILGDLGAETVAMVGGAQKNTRTGERVLANNGNTACPPINSAITTIATGGAQKSMRTGERVLANNGNTACPPINSAITTIAAGGGAANVAKIAALLGTPAAFIGTVGGKSGLSSNAGAGDYGRLFEEELRAAGVRPILGRSALPTGLCLVLRLENGERRILASPSAALDLDAKDIPGEAFAGAAAVVLDGYILGRAPLVERILEGARSSHIPLALDAASPYHAAAYSACIERLCREERLFLFMNEEEALAFYSALHPGNAGAAAGGVIWGAAQAFFQDLAAGGRGGGEAFPVIIVKRGEKGALVFSGGEVIEAPARAKIPLDPTGAGDAFAAGFLTAWLGGKTIAQCAEAGNRTAAVILDTNGSRVSRDQLAKKGMEFGSSEI